MFRLIKLCFIVSAFLLVSLSVYADKHPQEIGNADCMDCHTDATPKIAKEWEQSAHAYTGVKCGVCHGDELNFKKIPSVETCRGCHSVQIENNIMASKPCSSCHPTHSFNVHKQKDYK